MGLSTRTAFGSQLSALSRIRVLVLVLAAVLVLAVPVGRSLRAQDGPVLSAMKDEMDRSMSQLRIKDQPAPYYIEYEVEDRASTRVTSRLGALIEDLTGHSRTLRVEVRVGDYGFDNSLFIAPNFGSGVVQLRADGSTSAPLDDDYDAMRRQIWLASDSAYKRAVSVYARKKAAFQNRSGSDQLPDFSKEKGSETILMGLPATYVNRAWPERTQSLSAIFSNGNYRAFDTSEVSAADTRGTRYYLNTEGTRMVVPIQIASLRVSAEARAEDGMPIRDTFTLVEKNLQDLPPIAEIQSRTKDLADRVRTYRAAPIGDEYTGPVLIEGQASAEIVGQSLVPAVLARRPPESAGGRGGGPGGGRGGQVTPFLSRIGLRVLTDSFSLTDTPSLKEFGGRPVPGSYVVDDYGIRPKDITLVEKGRLVTLLAGRSPLKGLLQSNGHTRGGDVEAGVIQMQSSEAVSAAELRRKYLDLLKTQGKDFGYIVRGVANPAEVPPSGPGGPVILAAVRVSLDGDEQPVRGLRFGAIAPPVFRDLLDASRERTLYSYRATSTDAVSVIVPNLIFEELEIQRTREITQKPPSVPSPLSN